MMDAEPTGEDAEAGELVHSGVILNGRLDIPREILQTGKYMKIIIRGVFTHSEWGWRGWKIDERLNYLGSTEEAMSIVDLSREPSVPQSGRIRRVGQNRSDPWFTRSYWENKKYNFVYGGDQLSNSMCTRANYSMALSYLGIDVTPVEMSAIAGSKQVDHDPARPYDEITQYLAEQNGVKLTRVTGELDALFENYATDSSYSPVYVRMRRDNGAPHVFLIIGRDNEYYYVLDSVERDGVCVHPIKVDETKDRILKVRNDASFWEKYFNAKITFCHQWKIEETE